MIPQPTDALPNCSYFMTLVRHDDLQFRIGECVYVLREGDHNTSHESLLEEPIPLAEQTRESWDIFQIERLYKNERFAIHGFHSNNLLPSSLPAFHVIIFSSQ